MEYSCEVFVLGAYLTFQYEATTTYKVSMNVRTWPYPYSIKVIEGGTSQLLSS